MKQFNKKWLKRISPNPPFRRASADGLFSSRAARCWEAAPSWGSCPSPAYARPRWKKKNFPRPDAQTEYRRTICTHCAVGCGIIAEIQNGVWTGQEPDYESPINLGAHCTKGAAARDHGFGHRRVKFPMKLENGAWKRLAWDQAINEIGDKLMKIRRNRGRMRFSSAARPRRATRGPTSRGNSRPSGERIMSTTRHGSVIPPPSPAPSATFGYGAMTNSFNDMKNSKAMLFLGSNAAEAHPVAMQHILRAKEGGSKMIVVDPRFTRTAAHADMYARLRSGTDIPFLYGLLWHIFKNGWEDKEFIATRVYAMDEVRKEAANWPPEVVENVTGVPKDKMELIAKTMAENRPSTIVWCMGLTQHHMGTQNARLFCILQLALGNVGVSGGGANIFRGHDNVQGATDVGPNSHTLSCYYGLAEGAWKHWCRVWGVDYEWIKSRFDMTKQYDAGDGKMESR